MPPGDGGFVLFFVRGWGIRPSKKLPGGWSGLELTDTLVLTRLNLSAIVRSMGFGRVSSQ